MRNKILRPANSKYRYSYLFFYKINKGDLPSMYSCAFWCEFIDLVGVFWLLLFDHYHFPQVRTPISDLTLVWDWNSYIDRIEYHFLTGWFFLNEMRVAFCHQTTFLGYLRSRCCVGSGAHQMEPPSPIQALGVNPFPSRFIIRTVPRGDFARRRWEEPITTTKWHCYCTSSNSRKFGVDRPNTIIS